MRIGLDREKYQTCLIFLTAPTETTDPYRTPGTKQIFETDYKKPLIGKLSHVVEHPHNVNMQRTGLTFMLREIFDLAHYDTSTKDFVSFQAKGI